MLAVAAGRLLSTDASRPAKLSAARTLDAPTGRDTANVFAGRYESAEESTDDRGMEWDAWLEENAAKLKWNSERKRLE